MTTALVTGGAGFIGSNYIRTLMETNAVDRVINLDLLTYAGNLENLAEVEEDPRYRFIRCDVSDADALRVLVDEEVHEIVHFAAESHVDRSIQDASAFLKTNVIGTQVMIDFARKVGVRRFLHVSTDEVYGSLGPEAPGFTADTPISPNSPYAASKASSDLLVRAAVRTHGFPGLITRCSNNYGPFQFPEKLIPLMIANALEDRELPVYGDGKNVRDWIHVRDHVRALELVRRGGRVGGVYNIGADSERNNLQVVRAILSELGKPESLIRYVEDRPGHDRRYAIDATLMREELGFRAEVEFEPGIQETIRWYQEHPEWVAHVRSGAYKAYYEANYGWRKEET